MLPEGTYEGTQPSALITPPDSKDSTHLQDIGKKGGVMADVGSLRRGEGDKGVSGDFHRTRGTALGRGARGGDWGVTDKAGKNGVRGVRRDLIKNPPKGGQTKVIGPKHYSGRERSVRKGSKYSLTKGLWKGRLTQDSAPRKDRGGREGVFQGKNEHRERGSVSDHKMLPGRPFASTNNNKKDGQLFAKSRNSQKQPSKPSGEGG